MQTGHWPAVGGTSMVIQWLVLVLGLDRNACGMWICYYCEYRHTTVANYLRTTGVHLALLSYKQPDLVLVQYSSTHYLVLGVLPSKY
jgi:hypothetical protein